MGSEQSTSLFNVNAVGRDTDAIDPGLRIAAPVQSMRGYVNAELDAVRDQYVVGLEVQRGDGASKTDWKAGDCTSCQFNTDQQSCCPNGTKYGSPCCNPQTKDDKGDFGWWNPDGTPGPCQTARAGIPYDLRNCAAITFGCKWNWNCKGLDLGLCKPIGDVEASSDLSDFVFTQAGAARGQGNGSPVWYGSGFVESTSLTAELYDPGYTYVACAYNKAQIMSKVENLEAFKQRYGTGLNSCDVNSQDDYYKMMRELALTRSTNTTCSFTGTAGLNCSLMHDTQDPRSGYVLSWFQQLPPKCQDDIITTYCSMYGDDDDCHCFSRTSNPDYQEVATEVWNAFGKIPDGCWYNGCKSTSTSFVPTADRVTSGCPTSICQQVLDASKSQGLDIGKISAILNCGAVEPGGGSPPASPTTLDKFRDWVQTNWWIFLAAGVGLLLVIGLLYATLGRKKQSPSQSPSQGP